MKQTWYIFAAVAFVLSLGCIVNGPQNAGDSYGECSANDYEPSCDGSTLKYCQQGRCVGSRCEKNIIETIKCNEGCMVNRDDYYLKATCYQNCNPDTDADVCDGEQDVRTCHMEFVGNVRVAKYRTDACGPNEVCQKEGERAYCTYKDQGT